MFKILFATTVVKVSFIYPVYKQLNLIWVIFWLELLSIKSTHSPLFVGKNLVYLVFKY